MERLRPTPRLLLWTAMIVVVVAVLTTLLLTNLTLRTIEENLPNKLIQELFDLDLMLEDLNEVETAVKVMQLRPTEENPEGWKIEDILMVIQNDMFARTQKIVGDRQNHHFGPVDTGVTQRFRVGQVAILDVGAELANPMVKRHVVVDHQRILEECGIVAGDIVQDR